MKMSGSAPDDKQWHVAWFIRWFSWLRTRPQNGSNAIETKHQVAENNLILIKTRKRNQIYWDMVWITMWGANVWWWIEWINYSASQLTNVTRLSHWKYTLCCTSSLLHIDYKIVHFYCRKYGNEFLNALVSARSGRFAKYCYQSRLLSIRSMKSSWLPVLTMWRTTIKRQINRRQNYFQTA